MHCEEQILGMCFVVPTSGAEQSVFKFADFIAAFALLVIVYTISDVRYRFRLAIAPTLIHLYAETFVMIGIVGFGILLTDVWVAEHWLVPESSITGPIWRGMFAALFLALAMTWMWYAFIRPPIFEEELPSICQLSLLPCHQRLRGQLSIIAAELGRSAMALVEHARPDVPRWVSEPQQQQEKGKPPKQPKGGGLADIAHDVLLLIGNRKFCRYIVESSPDVAIQFFEAVASQKRAGMPPRPIRDKHLLGGNSK